MIKTRNLARCNVPGEGEECLSSARLTQVFYGHGEWTPEEVAHLLECDWCAYFALHGYDECPDGKRLLRWALGEAPTREERRHLAECPACAEDYKNVMQKPEEVPAPARRKKAD